jgi:mono/diheme cytochrome c family protein
MRTGRALVLAALGLAAAVAVALVLTRRHSPDGRAVFSASCSACHTLGARTTAAPGGDLSGYRLTAAEIASFARVMPVHPRLSRAEIDAVAAYVAAHERR